MTEFLSNLESNIMNEVNRTISSPQRYMNNLTWTVMIVLIGLLLHFFLTKVLIKTVTDFKTKQKLKKSLAIMMRVLVVTLVAIRWLNALNALVLILIGLSLFLMVLIRGILDNIIAWFIISKRDYFKIDDRIEIDNMTGNVVRIGIFHFELAETKEWLSTDTITGRVVKVPNNKIFNSDVTNYSQHDAYIWHEIIYTISHDSNWKKTKEIMTQTLMNYHHTTILPMIDKDWYEKLGMAVEPVLSMNVSDAGIVLSIRYLVDYRVGSKVKTMLHEEILELLLDQPDINFAVLEVRQVD